MLELRPMLVNLIRAERWLRATEQPSARRLDVVLGVLGGVSLVLYASVVANIGVQPVFLRWGFPLGEFIPCFLMYFAVLFGLGLLAAYWTYRAQSNESRTVALIVGFGILFRVLLLVSPPVLSSDVFRYIWDGRIQAAGANPYLTTPAGLATEAVNHEPLFQQQNRPFARTIYPPLAELAFRAVYSGAGESVTAMKALMVLGDVCALALLVRLLTVLGLPRSRVIVYAWHPLAVFESAGSGHVDALVVPWILLAVSLYVRGRDGMAGASLGAAVVTKIFPIVLLPALLTRRRAGVMLVCLGVIAAAYLPYLPGTGGQVLGHLPRFLSDPDEVFNPSLMAVLLFLGHFVTAEPIRWIAWIARCGLPAVLVGVLWTRMPQRKDVVGRIWVIGAAVTLLTLTLHPWYLLWLLPFLAIEPKPAWVYLSGAVILSYGLYLSPSVPEQILIGALEYVPFLVLLAWQGRARVLDCERRPLLAGQPPGHSDGATVS